MMSPSPNGLPGGPPPMNLPPMSGPGGFPGAPGLPGQKTQMSDYINAALRSIEQSIETRDPNQPMMPPHFNPGFNPPPPHMQPMGHFGQFDGSYGEMQFDETNPHHPAFHQSEAPMFGQNFGPISNELAQPDFQQSSPPPPQSSGNELRPSDQTGPSQFDHVSGHMTQVTSSHGQMTSERVSFYPEPEFQPPTQNLTSGGAPEAKKQKFNSSPDSGSRCSISPRDSGYDT